MAKTILDDKIVEQTLIVDTNGNAVSVTNNKLNVNATVTAAAGSATEAKQDTQITAEQAILAKIIAAPATEAKQDTQITAETKIALAVAVLGGAAVANILQMGGIAEGTVPAEVGDGAPVGVWFNTFGQFVAAGFNQSLAAQDYNDVAPALTQIDKTLAITQLTAPGSTAARTVNGRGRFGYALTVAAIDTNVVVSLTGNIDGANYATLTLKNDPVANTSMSQNQMTITANGTYHLWSDAPVDQVRLTFVSESGGVAATIDADFLGRRV